MGHLWESITYDSVNASTVAAELQKRGIEIDSKIITMHDEKKVGDFVATVHFHKEVLVEIPVKVVAEKDNKKEATAAEETPKAEVVEEAPKAEATTEEASNIETKTEE